MVDIIIVGAGTAGMTAALYALRAGKSVMLLGYVVDKFLDKDCLSYSGTAK